MCCKMLGYLLLPVVCFAQITLETISVPVTVYDFHSDRTNPEFECPHYSGLRLGMVAESLDADFKPVVGSNPYLNHSVKNWFRSWSDFAISDFSTPSYLPGAQYQERLSDRNDEARTYVIFNGFVFADHDTSFKNLVIRDSLLFHSVGNGFHSMMLKSFTPLMVEDSVMSGQVLMVLQLTINPSPWRCHFHFTGTGGGNSLSGQVVICGCIWMTNLS